MPSPAVKRYRLLPADPVPAGARPAVRRLSLARVASSPRSALGIDRHARLEQIAGKAGNGAGPGRGGA